MTRILRSNLEGNLHHAGARGIGQRPLFEQASDYQLFEKIMKKHLVAMHPDVILLSYCLMTNHLHYLLRGLVEALSRFMKATQQEYVQTFNRIRGRKGTLFEGRFWSRPCGSHEDLMKTIYYIDQNPVVGGLTGDVGDYAWGSAGAYLHGWETMPLARDQLQRILEPTMASGMDFAAAYRSCFGQPMDPRDHDDLTQIYRRTRIWRKYDLEELDYCSPEQHMEMEERAFLADGMKMLERRLLLPSEVEDFFTRSMCLGELKGFQASRKDPEATGVQLLRIAVLRDACGLTRKAIAECIGISPARVWRRLQKHRSWMETDRAYAVCVERAMADLLARSANRVPGV